MAFNILTIVLNAECNYNCAYCPQTKFRKQEALEDYLNNYAKLNSDINEDYMEFISRNPECVGRLHIPSLVKYMDSFIDDSAIIEVTGGEPTMHAEFRRLLDYLNSRRNKVLIKSNGSKDIGKHRDGITLLSAWHNKMPKFFDKMLILTYPGYEKNIEELERREIPYSITQFVPPGSEERYSDSCVNSAYYKVVDNYGFLVPCYSRKIGRANIYTGDDIPFGLACCNCKITYDILNPLGLL